MKDDCADIKPAIMPDIPADSGEAVSAMEPMRIAESSRHRTNLADLAVELAAHSTGFRRSLPHGLLTALADLVRAMNCYYSNLIEDHDTHPVDIERALKAEEEARNRALPAKTSHILEAILYRGELPRGDAADLLGTSERHARRVVAALSEHGVLASASTRAPLRLAFPASLASRWMPGLFPESQGNVMA